MKHYRISIDVDIEARDEEHARQRAALIYSDIEQARPWVVEVLPHGMQERIPLDRPPARTGSARSTRS
jgi:hypothetical protein